MLPPQLCSRVLPCTLLLAPPPSRLLARTSSRTVCPPFGSAGRKGVQPAADLQHVQRHRHELDVLRAPPARSLRRRRLPPSPLPARTSPCIVCPLLSARQYARVFNQPLSFNTSSVTTVSSMFEVRSARVACPQSVYSSPPLRVACAVVTHRFRSPSSHLLASARPASYALLSRLGSTRGRSTNR